MSAFHSILYSVQCQHNLAPSRLKTLVSSNYFTLNSLKHQFWLLFAPLNHVIFPASSVNTLAMHCFGGKGVRSEIGMHIRIIKENTDTNLHPVAKAIPPPPPPTSGDGDVGGGGGCSTLLLVGWFDMKHRGHICLERQSEYAPDILIKNTKGVV